MKAPQLTILSMQTQPKQRMSRLFKDCRPMHLPMRRCFMKLCARVILRVTPYPSASGGTKCCSRGGSFVLEQITNITALGDRDDRLSSLFDRGPAAFRR